MPGTGGAPAPGAFALEKHGSAGKAKRAVSSGLGNTRVTPNYASYPETGYAPETVPHAQERYSREMSAYRKRMRRVRQTEKALRVLKDGKEKRRKRRELERKLAKAKRPKKPKVLQMRHLARSAEKIGRTWGENPGALFGLDKRETNAVVEKFGRAVQKDVAKRAQFKAEAAAEGAKLRRKAIAADKAGREDRARRLRGKAKAASRIEATPEDPHEVGERWEYRKRRWVKLGAERLRERSKRQRRDARLMRDFSRSRRRGQWTVEASRQLAEATREDSLAAAFRREEKEKGRELRPLEKREIRKGIGHLLPDRGDSARYGRKLGAVPEQGAAMLARQAHRALRSPSTGKETRRVARQALRDIEAGRVEDPWRGLIRKRKGQVQAITGPVKQRAMRQAQRSIERAAAKAEDEATPDNVGEWIEKFGEQSVQAVATLPDSLRMTAEAGFEAIKGAGHDALYLGQEAALAATTGRRGWVVGAARQGPLEPYEFRRIEALAREYGETSPIFGFVKRTFETGDPVEGLKEAGDRANRNPIMVLEAVPAAAAGKVAVGRARHGSLAGARAYRRARPNMKLDDRDWSDLFSSQSRKERRAQVRGARRAARQQVRRQNEARSQGRSYDVPASTTSTYSRSSLIRGAQKLSDSARMWAGQDPYNLTGRRAGGRGGGRMGGEFRRRANALVRRHRAASLQYEAMVAAESREATRESGKVGSRAPNRLENYGFRLLYDGAVRAGREREDLDALIERAGRESGVGSEERVRLLRELRDDFDERGEASVIGSPERRARVGAVRERGLEMDDALVEMRLMTPETAARRRAIAGPIQRGEAVHVEKGDAMPGEVLSGTARIGEPDRDVLVRKGWDEEELGRVRSKVGELEAELAKARKMHDAARSVRVDTSKPDAKPVVYEKGSKKAARMGGGQMKEVGAARLRWAKEIERIEAELVPARQRLREIEEQGEPRRVEERVPGDERDVAYGPKAADAAVEGLSSAIRALSGARKRKDKKATEQAKARLAKAQQAIFDLARVEVERGNKRAPVVRLAAIERELADVAAQRRSAKRGAMGEDSAEMTVAGTGDWRDVAGMTGRQQELQAEAQALRAVIAKDAKAGVELAKEDGWVWVDWRRREGSVYVDTADLDEGAYVDYLAAKQKGRGDGQELSRDVLGQLRSDRPLFQERPGDPTVVASLDARARFLGLQRLKAALVQLSPYKRAMSQDEGRDLVARLNGKGEAQYTLVPAGRFEGKVPKGEWDQIDLTEFARAPRPGEKVYVVPVAVARVFKEVTASPGLMQAGLHYLSQRFVSAVLPFSVMWHAGNVLDLTTRLLLSGVNPVRERALWKELERALPEVLGEDQARLVLAHLQGHFGSREQDVRGARVENVTAASKSELLKGIGETITQASGSRGARKIVGSAGSVVQLGFDFATFLERPLVGMAGGKAARMLARDLGIEVGRHMETGRRIAIAMRDDPDLIEEFARNTLQIVGDYSGSAFGRNVLSAIDPFWTWMREANKFVFATLPAHHPVVSALLLQGSMLQAEVAERLGLPMTVGMPSFFQGAFPVYGMPGWYRPMAPFTSFGESARLLEDPLSYVLQRPLPYANRAAGNLAGYQWDSGLEVLAGRAQAHLGVSVPGFDPPASEEWARFEGDRTDLAIGSLFQSFVPGADAAYRAMVGGFPSKSSTFFDPEAREGTEVPWYEQDWLNPFGRKRDLDTIPGEAEEPRGTEREGVQPAERVLEEGDVMYNRQGEKLVVRNGRWVNTGSRHTAKVEPGRGRKPAKRDRDAAGRRLGRMFPQLIASDENAIAAIAKAAREFGVPAELLAGIYDVETNFGELAQATSSAGAVGHMQFMPETWVGWGAPADLVEKVRTGAVDPSEVAAYGGYGRDGDGDGKADPRNVFDAMMSAAAYLEASGVKDDPRGAIFAYNHADWYVDDVLAAAQPFASDLWAKAGTSARLRSSVPKGPSMKVLERHVVRVEGDEDIRRLAPELKGALVKLSKLSGEPVRVNSGNRTYEEQAALYEAYLNGTGNLAAPPGESNHNHGQAVDADLSSGQEALLAEAGLHQPVAGEPWHLEVVGGGTPVNAQAAGSTVPSAGAVAAPVISPPAPSELAAEWGLSADSERAGVARGRRRLLDAERVRLALSLLEGEIDVTEYVMGIRAAAGR